MPSSIKMIAKKPSLKRNTLLEIMTEKWKKNIITQT